MVKFNNRADVEDFLKVKLAHLQGGLPLKITSYLGSSKIIFLFVKRRQIINWIFKKFLNTLPWQT